MSSLLDQPSTQESKSQEDNPLLTENNPLGGGSGGISGVSGGGDDIKEELLQQHVQQDVQQTTTKHKGIIMTTFIFQGIMSVVMIGVDVSVYGVKNIYLASIATKLFNLAMFLILLVPIINNLHIYSDKGVLMSCLWVLLALSVLHIIVFSFEQKKLWKNDNTITMNNITVTVAMSVVGILVSAVGYIVGRKIEKVKGLSDEDLSEGGGGGVQDFSGDGGGGGGGGGDSDIQLQQAGANE